MGESDPDFNDNGYVHDRAPLPIGTQFSDGEHTYTIEKQLGSGGSARAYAISFSTMPNFPELKSYRVAKVPHDDREESLRRFLREARVLANISHRNVVKIHGVCSLPDGSEALVEDLVAHGKHLRDHIAEHPSHAPSLLLQGLYALRAIHERTSPSIVHRDVSPRNILVAPGPRLTLIDFGLAKEAVSATAGGLTKTGGIGTPGCIAPEQITDPANVDARADLYGLARTFAGAMVGCDPQHTLATEVDDPVMQKLLMRLSRRNREDRPASASAAIALCLNELKAAGYVLTALSIHVEEFEQQGVTPEWVDYLVEILNRAKSGPTRPEQLAVLGQFGALVWDAHALDAHAIFDRLHGSKAVAALKEITAYGAADPLADIYEPLFLHLDPPRRVEAFVRIAELAIRYHRYRLMDSVRRLLTLVSGDERDDLRSRLKFIDPEGTIRIPD